MRTTINCDNSVTTPVFQFSSSRSTVGTNPSCYFYFTFTTPCLIAPNPFVQSDSVQSVTYQGYNLGVNNSTFYADGVNITGNCTADDVITVTCDVAVGRELTYVTIESSGTNFTSPLLPLLPGNIAEVKDTSIRKFVFRIF